MVTDDMASGPPPGTAGPPPLGPRASRRLPPIAEVAVAAMALVLAGGIYVAAYLPRTPSVAPAVGLLAAAAVLVVANVVMLARLDDFAWHAFWQVSGWAFAAYVVIAGMIEFVMARDGTRGSVLAVMTLLIVIFAVDIPMLLGFSVARYQEPKVANIRS